MTGAGNEATRADNETTGPHSELEVAGAGNELAFEA